MKSKGNNKAKLLDVQIDNSLEKYKGKISLNKKLEKANTMLKTIGLPKSKTS